MVLAMIMVRRLAAETVSGLANAAASATIQTAKAATQPAIANHCRDLKRKGLSTIDLRDRFGSSEIRYRFS
jgi:hypothetical protein